MEPRQAGAALLALAMAMLSTAAALAVDEGGLVAQDTDRRIPGKPPPSEPVEPVENPNAVPPPEAAAPGDLLPLPDRWRILDTLGLDTLGRRENIFDPYNINVLKGDKPIFGQNWFFNLSLISDTVYEPARVPVSVGSQSTERAGSNNTFGKYGRSLFSQTGLVSLSLTKGDTAFKPPDFEVRFTPAFNFNHTDVSEVGLINVDPRQGTVRDDDFLGIQEAFVDYHLRNVSSRYDFDSLRVGVQPFSADFRGFLFQDDQLGVRLFGNRDNNRWQYNLAYFRRIEKDTNSGLNDFSQPLRNDDIVIANLYRQDLPVDGFTSQILYAFNSNREGNEFHFDKNGFLVRPAPIGDERGRNYDVHYFGFNGDGHFSRVNLTTSAYYAYGHQDHNMFSGLRNSSQTISAFFLAAEPSIDFDFMRLRFSGLFSSGDGNPQGGRATGFDAIFENPQFAGADTSYWIRQSVPLIGGGGVELSGRNAVIASLRSSKDQGQSNFVNPGTALIGMGSDLDVLPELRLSGNFNYIRFVNTAPLEFLRNQGNIPNSIGYDLSVAAIYRPLLTQNIVLRASAAGLFPGDGLKALYETGGGQSPLSGRFLYSFLFNIILTY